MVGYRRSSERALSQRTVKLEGDHLVSEAEKVRGLFEQCSQAEQQWNDTGVDRIESELILRLVFRGPVFGAFGTASHGTESELTARYHLLRKLSQQAPDADQRLNIFAQWAWGELDIPPMDSIGPDAVVRLSAAAQAQISAIPFNDLRYAGLVRIWLPYIERLFHDAKSKIDGPSAAKKHLLALKYDQSAIDIFTAKEWRSLVQFTCEWLATRGGIIMEKPRSDSDTARTLVNAYSRIFGSGAPHLLTCSFCGQKAVADFESQNGVSASGCVEHVPERLPASASEALRDLQGRGWYRSGTDVCCDTAASPDHDTLV